MKVPAYIRKSIKAMVTYDREKIVAPKTMYDDSWATEDYVDRY